LKISEKRSIILVVGFHRSGTSAITRVLNILGTELPHKLLKPVLGNNERGFWESETIVEIHEKILHSLGISWHSLDLIPPNWFSSVTATSYVEEIKSTLISEYGDSNLILVKDPRLCLFLPLWERVCQELNLQVNCVFQYRHPEEVVSSLMRRNGFTEVHAMLLWLHYTLQADLNSRCFNRTFVSFANLLEDWESVVRKIGETLSIKWPNDPLEMTPDVERYIDINLYHFRANNPEGNQTQYYWISQAYQALEALNKGDLYGMHVLNTVRMEYYASLDVLLEYQKLAIESRIKINELYSDLQSVDFLVALKSLFNRLKFFRR
jgi:hypothetical protein